MVSKEIFNSSITLNHKSNHLFGNLYRTFCCITAYGTCVVSGLGTLKGTIHSLLGQTNQVAGMCKSMRMLIRRLTSVAIRFDAWEETRVQR
ncbi:hypothetical protein BHF12_01860 [Escherichia coli]|nr:hypothetical protein BHF12_01860 [Escherichia coli]OEM21792.1 hypothetical protein BHF21_03405 [Escherichia coli]